jgi:hypothetical protein
MNIISQDIVSETEPAKTTKPIIMTKYITLLILVFIGVNSCKKECINNEPGPHYFIFKTDGDFFHCVPTPPQDSADNVGYLTTSYCSWSDFNPVIIDSDTIYPFRIRLDRNYILDRTISGPDWNFTSITFTEYCDSLSKLSTTEMKAFIKSRIVFKEVISECYYVPASFMDNYGFEDSLPYQIHRMMDAAKAINALIEEGKLGDNFCRAK